jgi:hypothetical protein
LAKTQIPQKGGTAMRANTYYHVLTVSLVILLGWQTTMALNQIDTATVSEWEATAFNNGRRMVRDSDGYLHAVWHSNADDSATPGGPCNIYYSYTTLPAAAPAASTWVDPILLVSVTTCTLHRNDVLHVVWQRAPTTSKHEIWHISTAGDISLPDTPAVWNAPNLVHVPLPPANDSLVPAIAINKNNHLHVVWQEENAILVSPALYSEIFYSRSADRGVTWSTAYNVSATTETNSQMPTIAAVVDAAVGRCSYRTETIHVAWNDDLIEPGSLGPPNIWYRRNLEDGADATWEPPENVSFISGHSSQGQDGYPSIIADTLDHAHVVWDHFVTPADPGSGGGYTPGVNPAMSNSFPGPNVGMNCALHNRVQYSRRYGGTIWSPVQTISLDIMDKDSEFPSVSLDRDETIHCAWHETASVADYDIYRNSLPAAGEGAWGAWAGVVNVTNDDLHHDYFPSEAFKRRIVYKPAYDFVWTQMSGGMFADALLPPHRIWHDPHSEYDPMPCECFEALSARLWTYFE